MFRTVMISAAAAIFAHTATAGPAAEAVIASAATELSAGDLSAEELTELVDVSATARFTLGRHTRTLSPEKIEAYTAAFESFLETTFDNHAHIFTGAEVTIVGSQDRSDRDSIVTVQVAMEGKAPETVRWRLLDRGGEWKVVDVQVQGLWLAIEQRAQVAAILDRSRSIDAAIARLSETETDFAETDRSPRG
ncbi:MAG: ABC transporter substrate-binding protein [Pseudomonadota bacterium]